MTSASGGAGYVTGTVIWSWTQAKMQLNFNTGTSSTWTEIYTFNSTKGFTGAGTDTPQYAFTTGSSCSPTCNTASTTSALPLLNPSGPYLNTPTGTGCQTFTPTSTGSNSMMTSMTASTTQVCSFKLADGRTFVMTSFTGSASTITTPTDCSCSQAVDIMFLVDHSASIDSTEMGQFKTFVTNFLKGLTVSSDKVNVGMTYFSRATTTYTALNWAMTGTSATVTAGMAGWEVPCVSGNAKCVTQTATATPYGIKVAADALYASSRQVPKILMTLTDGATNTGLQNQDCCPDNTLPDGYVGCNADIDTAVTYLKTKKANAGYAHTLTMISVGIGTECTSSEKASCSPQCKYTPHLLKFADGVSSNVLSVNDWTALQSQVANLMALTCTTNNNVAQTTCLNTCNGLCVCGGCSPPTGCTNNNCFSYTLSNGQCQGTAIPCPSQTCKTSTCDNTANGGQGQCTYTALNCSSFVGGCNNCIKYSCATTGSNAGTCSTPDTSACGTPVDCVQSAWGSWSQCTVTCGGGSQTGSRSITTQPANCGASCQGSTTTVPCNTQTCATPCTVGDWGAWGDCSATCGGGLKYQNRSITANATNGGSACPTLTQSTACNSQGCPVNCVWYPFGNFTPCTVTCGGGTQYQTRSIQTQAANGGQNCTGNDTNTVACNPQGCPVDCVWGSWSDFGSCTLSCGTGTQTRNRTQTTLAANGGANCTGNSTGTQNCNTQNCPIPCQWGAWTAFGACSVSCGGGSKTQTRSISQPALYGGLDCNPSDGSNSTSCNPQNCPIDCTWNAYGAWSNCSVSCGGGTQYQNRTSNAAQYGGQNCSGSSSQVQPCNTQGCPVDCQWSDWGNWTSCSVSCNGGVRTQSRTVLVASLNGGLQCNLTDDTKLGTCGTNPCPIDCVWGSWSDFNTCTKTCGTGNQTRTRVQTTLAQYGGVNCTGNTSEVQNCNTQGCPVPCAWSSWGAWGTCSVSCAAGTTTQTRTSTAPLNGGTPCNPSDGSNTTSCNLGPCPINCVWGDWSAFGTCSSTCGGGIQYQNRVISIAAQFGGINCTGSSNNSQPCNTQGCPVNCSWSQWGALSACTKSCGGGTNSRVRTVLIAAANGGQQCNLTDDILIGSCNETGCPVDCQWSAWSDYDTCTVTCGGGTQQATRTVTVASQNGGAACGSISTQNQTCSTQPCPIDCVGAWGPWADCSCLYQNQSRTYSISVPAQYGGASCPNNTGDVEPQACSVQSCVPVDCVGSWGPNATCSCDTNSTFSVFTVTTPAANNGTECSSATGDVQSYDCDPTGCPVDCVGYWTPATDCACVVNSTSRTFVITTEVQFAGKSCPFVNGTVNVSYCDPVGCPVDCEGHWAAWSTCDCDSKTQDRVYVQDVAKQFAGQDCNPSVGTLQDQQCTPSGCPVNCTGFYSDFSVCECATNKSTRYWTITTDSANGGLDCNLTDGEAELHDCVPQGCPENCTGDWSAWGSCSCSNQLYNRTFVVTSPARNGGAGCVSGDGDTDFGSCTPVNCPVPCDGSWTSWTTCSCSNSLKNRTFIIYTDAQNGGADCEATNNTDDLTACTPSGCPVPCVGSWGPFGLCSCQTGTYSRTYNVTSPLQNGGDPCPQATGDVDTAQCDSSACACQGNWNPWGTCSCTTSKQSRTCNSFNGNTTTQDQPCEPTGCPVNCSGFYSEFTECSCATNKSSRVWTITTAAANGGVDCNDTDQQTETVTCTPTGCPVNCSGTWSSWGTCSCSNEQYNRTFTLTQAAQNGGVGCAASDGEVEYGDCTPTNCPVPCNGSWTSWSSCACDTSSKNRTFFVYTDELNFGASCLQSNNTLDSTGCTPVGCPVDCNGTWTSWSTCSCATGNVTRTYAISTPRQNAGADCPYATGDIDQQACDTSFCPVDCQGNWNSWTVCSCSNSRQTRTWNVSVAAANGGTACPGQQAQPCTADGCPVNCVGSWSEWGTCPCPGNGGTTSTQTRNYTITTEAQNGGKVCDDSGATSQSCTALDCPVDCEGSWGEWANCSCLTNTHNRRFTITRNASNGGVNCLAEDGTTSTESCTPKDCKNYGPTCNGPDDNTSCIDSSMCTQNLCTKRDDGLYHCDWTQSVNCNDNSTCTSDSCDEQKGCVYVELNCNDNNACTNDFCDPVTGCYHENITCHVNASQFCFEPICDVITGCGLVQRICAQSKSSNNCTQTICNPNARDAQHSCEETQLCGFDIAVVAGIAGGAIAGIAIGCGVIALAAASGASYAIATTTGAAATTIVVESPLYVPDGTSGINLMSGDV